MKIIAHRGFSSHYTENTLTAFAQALLLNIDAIELDIHQVENEFLVFHDFYVDKLTNGTGRITNLSLTQARQLLVKDIDPIPTLHEVAALIGTQTTINVEIKSLTDIECFVRYAQNIINDYGCKLVISSFDHRIVQQCKLAFTSSENITYAALIAHSPINHSDYAKDLQVDVAAIDCDSVSAEFVAAAHADGLLVWCYTVNQDDTLAKMISIGVDGIFTDNPVWAHKGLHSYDVKT